MLREYVKWDYELRQAVQLEAVVDRALELAMTEPRGPVYLTLPREVLAQPLGEITVQSPSRRQVVSRRFPDPARIEEAAEALAGARNPLIVTSWAGRQAAAVEGLVALAEAGAIGVVEANAGAMNFPADHPCHVGYGFASRPHPAITEDIAQIAVKVPPSIQALNTNLLATVLHNNNGSNEVASFERNARELKEWIVRQREASARLKLMIIDPVPFTVSVQELVNQIDAAYETYRIDAKRVTETVAGPAVRPTPETAKQFLRMRQRRHRRIQASQVGLPMT